MHGIRGHLSAWSQVADRVAPCGGFCKGSGAGDTRHERVGEGPRTRGDPEDTRCGRGGGEGATKRSRGAGCAEGASNGVGAPSERDGRRGGGGGLAAPLRRRTLRWTKGGTPLGAEA